MSYSSARKKNYPCLRCQQHVKKTDKAIQCALCDEWVHKLCENMSDETFSVLDIQKEEQGQCFWTCKACHSYARKFDKRMRNVEARVTKLEEEKIPDIEEEIKNLKSQIDDISENSLDSSKSDDAATQSSITAAILEEMKERETRRCNVIVHSLAEPDAEITDSKDRIGKDIEKLQELLGQIEVEVNVNESYHIVSYQRKMNLGRSSISYVI